MKKVLISLAVAVLALAMPANCSAYLWDSDTFTIKNERILKVTSRTEHTSSETDITMLTYRPTNVKVVKGDDIAVKADVTTAAQRIIIQYSKDRWFEKNVMTRTFKNAANKGAVISTIQIYGEKSGRSFHTVGTRVIAQNGTNLSYRKLESDSSDLDLYVKESVYNAVRKKVSKEQTYTITGLKSGKYYARIRSQYEAYGYRAYSEWEDFEIK